MSRKDFGRRDLIEARSLPRTLGRNAQFANSFKLRSSELGQIICEEDGVIAQRWGMRLSSDGSFDHSTRLPGSWRHGPQKPNNITSNQTNDALGQRRHPQTSLARGPHDLHHDPATKGPGYCGVTLTLCENDAAPALVPVDESWLKPHPLFDGALEGALEDGLDEPIEPTRLTPSIRPRNPGMIHPNKYNERSSANAIPRRPNVSQATPPGFSCGPQTSSHAPSSKIIQDKLAKGPTARGGFAARMAKRDRRAPLARINIAPEAPQTIATGPTDTEVMPATSAAQMMWKNDIDRMFAPASEVQPSLPHRSFPSPEANGVEDTSPAGLKHPVAQSGLEHESMWNGRQQPQPFSEPVPNEDEGELAPNVLSFFNAVKAQAVIGANAKHSPGTRTAADQMSVGMSPKHSSTGHQHTSGNQHSHPGPFDVQPVAHDLRPPPQLFQDGQDRQHMRQHMRQPLETTARSAPVQYGKHQAHPSSVALYQQHSPPPQAMTPEIAQAAGGSSYSADEFFQFFEPSTVAPPFGSLTLGSEGGQSPSDGSAIQIPGMESARSAAQSIFRPVATPLQNSREHHLGIAPLDSSRHSVDIPLNVETNGAMNPSARQRHPRPFGTPTLSGLPSLSSNTVYRAHHPAMIDPQTTSVSLPRLGSLDATDSALQSLAAGPRAVLRK